MKYAIFAGEASGDLHAASLMDSIMKSDPDARFCFFGGDRMQKTSGTEPYLHYSELNVMGFSEVIRKLPKILKNLGKAKEMLRTFRPDAVILVDFPDFNLRIANFAKKNGIKVHYFISPKIWAWKEYRLKEIKHNVDAMYSILPFEKDWYGKRGFKVTYVGNPSVKEIDNEIAHIPPLKHLCTRQGIADPSKPMIALLPGSRKGEIRNNLPIMIEAAKKFPEFQYIVAAAPSISEKFYRTVAQDPSLPLVFNATIPLVKYSSAALVTSGTATLETALTGTPQVVCYRANGSKLSYKLMAAILKIKYVSLPNLIAGSEIVPELLVHKCTPESVRRALAPLLYNTPQREWQINGYRLIRRRLGTSDAAQYAGRLIVESLTES